MSDFVRPVRVENARTHNLAGVTCEFPRGKLTVVSGVSGSGKSSLAFDTLYAEGQRRYVETLSTYVRQFVPHMRRPPVDEIHNLPPSIGIRQGGVTGTQKSTVGTMSEVVDHLQVLFAAVGTLWCKKCGTEVVCDSPASAAQRLRSLHADKRIILLGAAVPQGDDTRAAILRALAIDGFRKLYQGGKILDIDSPEVLDAHDAEPVRFVVDRLQVSNTDPRLEEALETAFRVGSGVATVLLWDDRASGVVPEIYFVTQRICTNCWTTHAVPSAALFNPSSAAGACPACSGNRLGPSPELGLIVPDPSRSVEQGALVCFAGTAFAEDFRKILLLCAATGVRTDVPWGALTDAERNAVFWGNREYQGIAGFFAPYLSGSGGVARGFKAQNYLGHGRCLACRGTGLSDDARAIKISGCDLGQVLAFSVADLRKWLEGLNFGENLSRALSTLLRDLRSRVEFLDLAGVGYLALDRSARTLSGGEFHRVMLAACVGRQLTDACYVLDEPTAGLHAHDTARLLTLVTRLRDIGNTVVVVEHDPDVVRMADWLIELGPGAGARGGKIVYAGPPSGIDATNTATGEMLRQRRTPPAPATINSNFLTVSGAWGNNLKGVSASFPKGRVTAVVGVSGSGKSTLIFDVLLPRCTNARLYGASSHGTESVLGDDFSEIVVVDQDSLPRTTRSCALTVTNAYAPLRDLFAQLDGSLEHGLSPGHFSFNVPGGRCERCQGTGYISVEMHFVADVELRCDVCDGKRFTPLVQGVKYLGRSISDVFEMTVDEGVEFFADSRTISRLLRPLQRVGLGYLKLGQPTSQLSGGELQRLKLAGYVADASPRGEQAFGRSGALFVLDEPTVGLHMRDVAVLMDVFEELAGRGNTVIVIEHNLDVLSRADWVVEMGPGAGPDGGSVVFEGTVQSLLERQSTLTAKFLQASLNGDP